ncbi:MAG: hypothetical protein KY468_09090 [Armatimonadetes bacterium]|nr:hypothetical protein [Armatimonadota bacterium]
MNGDTLELEGTWEEILKHSEELSGRKVRLTAFPKLDLEDETLPPEVKQTLEWLEEWKNTPLTEEEIEVLEEFEQFRKEHPFRLRVVQDEL